MLPRPPAKRAAALAGINALSNICQIYSPFLYPSESPLPFRDADANTYCSYPAGDGPRYGKNLTTLVVGIALTQRTVNAMCVNMGMSIMAIVFATVLRFHLKALNRKLNIGEVVDGVNADSEERNVVEEQGLPGTAVNNGFRFLV